MRSRSGEDLYAILGVAHDADETSLKRAYRRLAQRYHPDRNAGDTRAEDQFKRVSAAYAVLSDATKRRNYDEFGEIALSPNFDAERARRASRSFGSGFGPSSFDGSGFGRGGDPDLGGFSPLFENLFGGRSGAHPRPGPQRGADLEVALELDFLQAARGCERRIDVDRPTAQGQSRRESLSVRIPAGVRDATRIRLAGRGAEGRRGGADGDLFARVRIRPHPVFRREGNDLLLDAPISILEAMRGAEVAIPSLEGRITLQVPPDSDGGTRLRLRGKGIPAAPGRAAGDLYVTLRVRIPKRLDAKQRLHLETLLAEDPNQTDGAHLRRELFD